MGTILANDVIERANDILNDVLSERWPDTKLMQYLGDAQRAVVTKRPDASVANTSLQCTASAKQVLPPEGLRLINVMANTVSGRPITPIDVDILNEQVPDWRRTQKPTTHIEHFVYDDRDPKHFYVYPTPIAEFSIDLVYSVAPAEPSDKGSPITIDDTYFNALVEYVLFRAYQRDTENQANMARAQSHYAAFDTALSGKIQADAAASPNNG